MVISMPKGEISVPHAAHTHGLTVAEIEDWQAGTGDPARSLDPSTRIQLSSGGHFMSPCRYEKGFLNHFRRASRSAGPGITS